MRISVPSWSEGLRAWQSVQDGWPAECGAAWLGAERGRVTGRQEILVARLDGRAAAVAHVMLLDGTEERHGYNAADVLFGALGEEALAAGSPRGPFERLARARGSLRAEALLPSRVVALTGTVQPGILWDLALGEQARAAALSALVEHLGHDPAARSVVVSAVPRAGLWTPLREILSEVGFVATGDRPIAQLAIPADGIEEYLDQFSRSSRKNFRREMRVFAAAVDQVTLHRPERMLAEDVVALQQYKYQKYGYGTSKAATRDRLQRGAELPGMRVQIAEQDGRAIAFTAFVEDRGLHRLVSRFSGTAPNDVFAYFNMCYYERVRYGAQQGFTSLSLGPESYRAKVARGARVLALDTFVRAGRPQIAGALRQAAEARMELEMAKVEAELTDVAVGSADGGWSLR